jgi:hypothetical protein
VQPEALGNLKKFTSSRLGHVTFLNLGCLHPVARVISYDIGF